MPKSITIPNKPDYPISMNWDELRKEGIKHLERFGSSIWTDFNTHDPGITILEVLCYAITDLGYRVNSLNTLDLFAVRDREKAFHTAAEILPTSAVTALDIRKMIIDLDGVKNAWLVRSINRDVHLQYKEESVDVELGKSFEKYIAILKAGRVGSHLKVQIETKNLSGYDATNCCCHTTRVSDYQIKWKEGILKEIEVVTRKSRISLKLALLYLLDHEFANTYKILIRTKHSKDFDLQINAIKNHIESNNPLSSDLLKVINEWIKEPNLHPFMLEVFYQMVILELNIHATQPNIIKKGQGYNLYNPQGIFSILIERDDSTGLSKQEVTENVYRTIHQNRPLSEDFVDIDFVNKQDFAICANINLCPDADPVKIKAAIKYAIDEFVLPSVRFWSLEQMMNKYAHFTLTDHSLEQLIEAMVPGTIIGKLHQLLAIPLEGIEAWNRKITEILKPEEIKEYSDLIFHHLQKSYNADPVYQGPLLTHGFIDEGDLAKSSITKVIYKSDLFNLISKIEGVEKITQFEIAKCLVEEVNDDIHHAPKYGSWCLNFACDCIPTLNLECSIVHFNQGSGYFEIDNILELEEQYEILKNQHIKINRTGQLDLPIKIGTFIPDLMEFTSVQEDMPRTYQIGNTFIAASEPPQRKAKASQLVAYLTFYDQILANYLAHLAEVRALFAIESSEEQLHIYQSIRHLPGLKNILSESYENALPDLCTGGVIADLHKKEKVVNHLLARFGENFSDFVLGLYQTNQDLASGKFDQLALTRTIAEKRKYLDNLPLLSAGRGSAFNYQPEPYGDNSHFWNSDNVSGLKKRVSSKMGMENWKRKTISCEPKLQLEIRGNNAKKKRYYFVVQSLEKSLTLLESVDRFTSRGSAENAGMQFLEYASNSENYNIVKDPKTQDWFFGYWPQKPHTDPGTATLLYDATTKERAEMLHNTMLDAIEGDCLKNDFHLIEHILLRPLDPAYEIIKPDQMDDLCYIDPYSFVITIFVPFRVGDPGNIGLKKFEQLVRAETPAHIKVRICPLIKEDMLVFEKLYFNWLCLKTQRTPEAQSLRDASNAMICFINRYSNQCLNRTDEIVDPNCK